MAHYYGIDISEHQGNINIAAQTFNGKAPQFVIIRAGVASRADNKFARNVAECKRLGIPFGVYWYTYALNQAQGLEEMDIFLKTIAPYKNDIGVGVWIDQEDADHYKANHGMSLTHNVLAPMTAAMAAKVEAAGYYTGIYCSLSWLPLLSGNCDKYDKWTAKWDANNGLDNSDTNQYGTIHQFTSKPLDRDECYVDLSIYKKGGKTTGSGSTSSSTTTTTKKSNDTIAQEVIAGKWGNGTDRTNRLKAAGYSPTTIQALVNQKLGAKTTTKKSNDTIAQEVIAGKWGNGTDRVNRLKAAGYDPNTIQALVNKKLGTGSKAAIDYNDLAKRAIRGEFGNYPQRKTILDGRYGAGTYEKVQAIINKK